eukprot:4694129-Heterocapsa_arctica.AAC.1
MIGHKADDCRRVMAVAEDAPTLQSILPDEVALVDGASSVAEERLVGAMCSTEEAAESAVGLSVGEIQLTPMD